MTDDRMAFAELLEKGSDADLLREMFGYISKRLMDVQVEELCNARHGERSSKRTNSRNGYRERRWETRAGSVPLQIPKLRQGSYLPPFLEPRRAIEKALTAVVQEAYIKGVSTRSMDALIKSFGVSGMSKSQVSRLCEDIDVRVKAFLDRPIKGDWPYLWMDATYVRVREGGSIIKVALIIAVAVNAEGKRQILGMSVGTSEAEPFWRAFLQSLIKRGLKGIKLVISDAHEGLKAAAARVLRAPWQRCRVHFMRQALAHAHNRQQRSVIAALLRTIFVQDSEQDAHRQWQEVADQMRKRIPKLAALMEEAEYDVLAHMSFPKEHRTRLHSTNIVERLNGEIKRRTNVVGIFPNEQAIVRLAGAVLLELNDDWALQTRYMRPESMYGLVDNPLISLPVIQG